MSRVAKFDVPLKPLTVKQGVAHFASLRLFILMVVVIKVLLQLLIRSLINLREKYAINQKT
jgi:hypothetical protein